MLISPTMLCCPVEGPFATSWAAGAGGRSPRPPPALRSCDRNLRPSRQDRRDTPSRPAGVGVASPTSPGQHPAHHAPDFRESLLGGPAYSVRGNRSNRGPRTGCLLPANTAVTARVSLARLVGCWSARFWLVHGGISAAASVCALPLSGVESCGPSPLRQPVVAPAPAAVF
eukprot:COSAG01_NODE_1079_length_11822_cov_4.368762_16_plen_171_part_00